MNAPLNDQTKPDWAATKQDQQAYSAERVATDKVRTRGWWMFDKIVHSGINGVLNIAASIWMVHDKANYDLRNAANGENNKYSSALKKAENLTDIKAKKSYMDKLPWFGGKKLNFYTLSDEINGSMGGFFNRMAAKGKDGGFYSNTMQALGRFAPGVIFLSWGGHVTNSIMWLAESPKIKPKAVKFLDKLNDTYRKMRGEEITEAELIEREEIYKRLDGDLAGKSLKGVWGARFVGMATITLIASLAEAIDRTWIGTDIPFSKKSGPAKVEDMGIMRLKQLFMQGSKVTSGILNTGLERVDLKWDPAYIQNANSSVKAAYAKNMAENAVLEVAGTGITAGVQYLTLMSKELFGFGLDTNVKDKSDDKSTPQKPIAHGNSEAPLKHQGIPIKKAEASDKPQDKMASKGIALSESAQKKFANANEAPQKSFSDKTKPAANGYQEKVLQAANDSTLAEQGV